MRRPPVAFGSSELRFWTRRAADKRGPARRRRAKREPTLREALGLSALGERKLRRDAERTAVTYGMIINV